MTRLIKFSQRPVRIGIYLSVFAFGFPVGPWVGKLRLGYTPKAEEIISPALPIEDVLRAKIPTLSKTEVRELSLLFLSLCRQYGFSPAFILGLIDVESAFRPKVESIAGAVGLMQILPSTGAPIARELGLVWIGKKSLIDPATNLRIGFHYLDYLRKLFSGKRQSYVTAYNWGPATVGNLVQKRRSLPLDYFRKIERSQRRYAFLEQQLAAN